MLDPQNTYVLGVDMLKYAVTTLALVCVVFHGSRRKEEHKGYR